MWIFKYGIPLVAIFGFGQVAYRILIGEVDADKMGLPPACVRLFGLANLLMGLCWLVVFFGLWAGAQWIRSLAFFVSGMFMFEYMVSVPFYRSLRAGLFEYWVGVALIVSILYSLWI